MKYESIMDKRKERRLRRRLPCVIYFKHEEYTGEVLDMSPSGIAVATYEPIDVLERDIITVAICDEHTYLEPDQIITFSNTINCKILDRNVIDNFTRLGCVVSNDVYTDYVSKVITDETICRERNSTK